MPTQQTLLAFALVSAGLMVIPGPSNFFLLAHGIGHGRRSALAAMTGIETASAIRVLLAAAGPDAPRMPQEPRRRPAMRPSPCRGEDRARR